MEGKEWVKKRDNTGTFHFGGSSYLVIFESGKQLARCLQLALICKASSKIQTETSSLM